MARRRPTEPQTANPARGAALVVVAVLIGLFFLRNGLDTSETVVASPTNNSGSTDGGTAGTTTGGSGGTTTTTLAVRPPASVPTIVLNASGVKGAAKKYSDALAAAGYDLTNPVGANATADVTATQVLFGPGFNKEATVVAAAIGAPTSSVQALGTTLPGSTSGASVIVVLGPDLGSKTPTSTPTTSG